MRAALVRGLGVAAIALTLSACASDREPRLLNLRADGPGPDEFAILPTRPLQAPPDFATLPPPTPGGINIADPTPKADAIAALGGDPGRVTRGGGVRDPALIASTTRYGIEADIRGDLATADLAIRRANNGRLLERLAGTNVYFRAYRAFQLDQHAELERFRAAGVRTPSAPPAVSD